MFRIRSLIKKENGICPICALPYTREKRTLHAAYFDHTYDITAWTLRCAECGYEVIMSGMARISEHADDGTGARPALAFTAAPAADAVPDGVAETLEPPGTLGSPGLPEPPESTEGSKAGDAAGKQEEQDRLAEADSPRDPKVPEEPGQGQEVKTPEAAAGTEAKETQEAAKKLADGGKDTEDRVGKDSKVDAKDGGNSEAVPEKAAKAGYNANPNVGHPVPEDRDGATDPAKAAYPEKPVQPGEKAVSQTKEEGTAKDKSAGRESAQGNKKAQGAKEQAKNQPDQKASAKQDKAAEAGIRKLGAPAQPVPKGRKPDPFGSGFAGGGMFSPSPSALNNLASLKASVYADTAKRQADAGKDREEGQPKESGKQEGTGNTGKGRPADSKKQEKPPAQASQPLPAPKNPPAEPDVARDGKATEKTADTGGAEKSGKAEPFADNKKPAGPGEPVKPEAPTESGKAEEAGAPKEADGAAKAQKNTGKDNPEPDKAQAQGQDAKDKTANTGGDNSAAEERAAQEPAGEPGKKAAQEAKDAHEAEGAKDTKDTKDTKEAEGDKEKKQKGEGRKDLKEQAMEATRKLSNKIPPDLAEKIPVISQISKQQKRVLFTSEEKRFLEQHVPSKQVIINDLVYDTDSSEMFLRMDGRHGLDQPCVHYNYRTKNGNFFRCTVKYKHEDSIRPLDMMEAKRMLEEHPDLYRKFFPDSVSDA